MFVQVGDGRGEGQGRLDEGREGKGLWCLKEADAFTVETLATFFSYNKPCAAYIQPYRNRNKDLSFSLSHLSLRFHLYHHLIISFNLKYYRFTAYIDDFFF